MVLLTVVTSLPRLTKVSKPIALIAENLETYSVAIIFLAMRLAPMFSDRGPDEVAMEASLVVAGFPGASLPVDLLLGIVSALNIIVINMVKLSCEFFIWLIPFPTVDALFELANKSLSATLMAIYCYSPFAAACLNFMILGVCLLMFDTVWRRVRFCRGILLEPLLARIFPAGIRSPHRVLMDTWRDLWVAFESAVVFMYLRRQWMASHSQGLVEKTR